MSFFKHAVDGTNPPFLVFAGAIDDHTRYPYYEHAGDTNASEPFWWLASTIDTTR